ncbi:hypothetical protein F4774DRAFT_236970 [Daldinia eschscholtzii]|nr:hypothetical protein F4774DRAFT_236970 [Daldinia eschscholtzii]
MILWADKIPGGRRWAAPQDVLGHVREQHVCTYIVHYIEALIRLDVKCLPSSLGTSIVIPYAKGTTMNVWMYLSMHKAKKRAGVQRD